MTCWLGPGTQQQACSRGVMQHCGCGRQGLTKCLSRPCHAESDYGSSCLAERQNHLPRRCRCCQRGRLWRHRGCSRPRRWACQPGHKRVAHRREGVRRGWKGWRHLGAESSSGGCHRHAANAPNARGPRCSGCRAAAACRLTFTTQTLPCTQARLHTRLGGRHWGLPLCTGHRAAGKGRQPRRLEVNGLQQAGLQGTWQQPASAGPQQSRWHALLSHLNDAAVACLALDGGAGEHLCTGQGAAC